MKQKIKKLILFLMPIVLLSTTVIFLANFEVSYAQSTLGTGVNDPFKHLTDKLPGGFDTTQSGEEVAKSLIINVIGIVKYIIGGVALIFGILYSVNLIFAQGKEDVINKQKANFLWLFTGFLILLISDQIAALFNPEKATSEALIDFKVANDQLRDITNYITWLFGSIAVLLMTVSGVKMITAGGEEEKITKEKRHVTWGGIGLLVILLANNIVSSFYVVNAETGTFEGAADTTTGIEEIGGVIRLILIFLGPLAIIYTIYAGFQYLTALDNEERANKAKRMIVGGVTGVIVVYSAYAIVNTFILGL